MISIIVPIYNREQTLRKCVDSILRQTWQNFELLLIDDGSHDGSGAICDEYARKDNRIKAFHKKNGGVSSARNVGLEHARGEWVSFVDADDFVGEHFLEFFFMHGCDADLLAQGVTIVDANDLAIDIKREHDDCLTGVNIIDYALKGIQIDLFGYNHCKLFLRSIIVRNHLRYNEDIHQREDLLFMMDYLQFVRRIITVNAHQYHYWKPALGKQYRSQDHIGLNMRLCRTMLKARYAEERRREIMGLFYGYILGNLFFADNIVPKGQYIEPFIQQFYAYRHVLPFWWYRKKMMPFVLFFRLFDCKALYVQTLRMIAKR